MIDGMTLIFTPGTRTSWSPPQHGGGGGGGWQQGGGGGGQEGVPHCAAAWPATADPQSRAIAPTIPLIAPAELIRSSPIPPEPEAVLLTD